MNMRSFMHPQYFTPQTKQSQSTYAVYIHYPADNDNKRLMSWERREATKDKNKALQSARALKKFYKYQKIEVIENYINERTKQKQERTIKIYGQDSSELNLHSMQIALAILCLAIIFTGTLCLT